MHELSVVQSIVRIAEGEVKKNAAKNVNEIELDIGDLSGIEFSAFDFAWPIAIKDTVLDEAKRKVNHIPAIAICENCGTEYKVKQLFDECPECKKFAKDVIQGKELRIKKIKLNL